MSRFRNLPQRDYTIIRNTALRNPKLSLRAKGMLALMLSFSPGWRYSTRHLQTLSTEGRDAVRATVRELEEHGYVRREQTRDETGKVGPVEYLVTDQEDTVDGFSGDGPDAVQDGAPPVDGLSGRGTNAVQDSVSSVDGKTGAGQTVAGKPATKKTYIEEEQRKKRERTPPTENSALNQALAEPDSPEARAFLAANGISTDQRPEWELRTFLKRTLGSQHDHPQVQENITAWANTHDLLTVKKAWNQAVARRKREPTGLRAVHHFVDILNGTYQPDSTDLQAARTAAAPQPLPYTPGDRVTTTTGETLTVTDVDEAGQWLIFDNHDPLRPNEVRPA